MTLYSQYFDLVCVYRKYLVDITSYKKLFLMSNSKWSLSSRISASIFKTGLDVALYTPAIIQIAFVCTNFKVAQVTFLMPFFAQKEILDQVCIR